MQLRLYLEDSLMIARIQHRIPLRKSFVLCLDFFINPSQFNYTLDPILHLLIQFLQSHLERVNQHQVIVRKIWIYFRCRDIEICKNSIKWNWLLSHFQVGLFTGQSGQACDTSRLACFVVWCHTNIARKCDSKQPVFLRILWITIPWEEVRITIFFSSTKI